MPYMCVKCLETREDHLFRVRKVNKSPVPNYRNKECVPCERLATKKHQQENREYWQNLNKRSHARWTPEFRAKRLLKAHVRHQRLKPVGWDAEFTEFVTEEAHLLRQLRNDITGFAWHVDHVIPLNGKLVSGLHVWNNLAVIPASINLSKGNR